MLMSLEQALLQDVLDHPEDDTPLLVLADWLMEQDHPRTGPLQRARGEFIRLQILLANTPYKDSARRALKRRERELQERFEQLWMAELGVRVSDWQFDRGLVGLWLMRW